MTNRVPSKPTCRRMVASYLRYFRHRAGMTQAEVRAVVDVGPESNLSRWENRKAVPHADLAEKLCQAYGASISEQARVRELIKATISRKKPAGGQAADAADTVPDDERGLDGVWEPARELFLIERDAAVITEYAVSVIPGLMQTPAYARALLTHGEVGPRLVEQYVAARMERAANVWRDDPTDPPPTYRMILRESALDWPVGGPETMAEQLHHLAARAEQPNIHLQVIPRATGAHPCMVSGFTLLDFAEDVDDGNLGYSVLYTETTRGAEYTEDLVDVHSHRHKISQLLSVALPAVESHQVITSMAKGHKT
jgi:transcriptional regulator with XRE-family HTH domain